MIALVLKSDIFVEQQHKQMLFNNDPQLCEAPGLINLLKTNDFLLMNTKCGNFIMFGVIGFEKLKSKLNKTKMS